MSGAELDPALIEPPYPFQAHLGFRIVAWRRDYCRFELPIAAFLGNRHGIVHGGVHASLLDTAMGFAGCWTGDADAPQMALTLSLTTHFLGQARGDMLIGEGRRTGGGARVYFAEGSVFDGTGALVASGSGVFRYKSR